MPKTKVKAVVFDLDGTLLNTLESLANCYNRVLTSHHLTTHDTEAYRYFIGNGARNCLVACLSAGDELSRMTPADIDELLTEQQRDYRANWQRDVTIYPGIMELLEVLEAQGFALAVLTNKDQEFAERCVKHFFPDTPFRVVQGYSATVPHKPNPSGAKRIAQQLGLPLPEMVLVGDTSVDIETANAAGMRSVGALWGFRDRDELDAAGAEFVVERPQDLTRLPIY